MDALTALLSFSTGVMKGASEEQAAKQKAIDKRIEKILDSKYEQAKTEHKAEYDSYTKRANNISAMRAAGSWEEAERIWATKVLDMDDDAYVDAKRRGESFDVSNEAINAYLGEKPTLKSIEEADYNVTVPNKLADKLSKAFGGPGFKSVEDQMVALQEANRKEYPPISDTEKTAGLRYADKKREESQINWTKTSNVKSNLEALQTEIDRQAMTSAEVDPTLARRYAFADFKTLKDDEITRMAGNALSMGYAALNEDKSINLEAINEYYYNEVIKPRIDAHVANLYKEYGAGKSEAKPSSFADRSSCEGAGFIWFEGKCKVNPRNQ